MEFFGLTPEDYADETNVQVFPDNAQAVRFFADLGSGSWAIGHGGPTGLRYESFREVRLAHRVRAADWPRLFSELRVLEQAALEEIHKG